MKKTTLRHRQLKSENIQKNQRDDFVLLKFSIKTKLFFFILFNTCNVVNDRSKFLSFILAN